METVYSSGKRNNQNAEGDVILTDEELLRLLIEWKERYGITDLAMLEFEAILDKLESKNVWK